MHLHGGLHVSGSTQDLLPSGLIASHCAPRFSAQTGRPDFGECAETLLPSLMLPPTRVYVRLKGSLPGPLLSGHLSRSLLCRVGVAILPFGR